MVESSRILVVDDEQGLLKLFRKALQSKERTILTAPDGRTRLQRSAPSSPTW